jgi:hypothetical protein
MNLVLKMGAFKEGCYATVFFVGDRAIKVFKRRPDATPEYVSKVFESEVKAYELSAGDGKISHYTKHFIGKKTVCMIEDGDSLDISHNYYLNLAYEMFKLQGEPRKISTLTQTLQAEFKSLFRSAKINHLRDCSIFFNLKEEPTNVIDFAVDEYVLEHDPV